jgi:pyridoxal phosphate enzyme (YggS family)
MIRENIDRVRSRIAAACARCGRNPAEITLVAVSKTFSADLIAEACDAGVQDIGENYVQELLAKREALRTRPIRWHFVGHLQANKVKYLVPWVHLIHAVDSLGVARELEKRAAQAGTSVDILIEVNTTGEETKFGVKPEATVEVVKSLADFSHLRIAGLMTIGPFMPDPEASRPMFRRLRRLKDELAGLGQPNVHMHHLSMGMTGDFEVAIEEGATLLRLGTAIFGQRTKQGQSTHRGDTP